MTTKCGPQDMPPAGGYNPLQWERIKLKTVFGTKLCLGLYAVATTVGFAVYHINWKEVQREMLEMRSARHAILPLLIAERDRAFLKQAYINREEEKELMKNDPDWEVGTYYREPVYITIGKEKWAPENYYEFFAHADWWDANYRVARRYLS